MYVRLPSQITKDFLKEYFGEPDGVKENTWLITYHRKPLKIEETVITGYRADEVYVHALIKEMMKECDCQTKEKIKGKGKQQVVIEPEIEDVLKESTLEEDVIKFPSNKIAPAQKKSSDATVLDFPKKDPDETAPSPIPSALTQTGVSQGNKNNGFFVAHQNNGGGWSLTHGPFPRVELAQAAKNDDATYRSPSQRPHVVFHNGEDAFHINAYTGEPNPNDKIDNFPNPKNWFRQKSNLTIKS